MKTEAYSLCLSFTHFTIFLPLTPMYFWGRQGVKLDSIYEVTTLFL